MGTTDVAGRNSHNSGQERRYLKIDKINGVKRVACVCVCVFFLAQRNNTQKENNA